MHQTDAVLGGMDEWNKNTHGRSGLIERVKASTISEAEAEATYLEFARYIPSRTAPCAATPSARTAASRSRYMPTPRRLVPPPQPDVRPQGALPRWRPDVQGLEKKGAHKALDDILESIAELRYYREHFLKV